MTEIKKQIITSMAGFGVVVLAIVGLSAPISAAEAPKTPLAEHQQIDKSLGAFDDPIVVRMRTRVPPTWAGPQAEPPVTERRNCPGFLYVDPGGLIPPVFVVPGFC